MFGSARRALDLAILFLALYAFAVVPLGSRTGLEHLRAILGTDEAREAGAELGAAIDRLRQRVLADAPGRREEGALPRGVTAAPPRLPRDGRPPANAAIVPAEAPDASAPSP